MSITDRRGHDRPQEKMLANGRAALPVAELLTIPPPPPLTVGMQAVM